MQKRTLGDGLVVSAIGFGCMGLSQGYGPADDDTSLAAMHRSLDAGATLMDTAMSYGGGHNERLLAQVLAARRDEVVLATKFGIVRHPDGVVLDGRPENVAGYCDASLQRLGVETIDLYYLHRVDPRVPVADTVGAMSELVAAGKVRHLGLSETSPANLTAAVAVHPISAVQFEWSLFWREPEDDVVPTARELGIGLVPYSPLGRGMLAGSVTPEALAATVAGDFRHGDPRFGGSHLRRNLDLVSELGRLAVELDCTASQLALAWLLSRGEDVVPIPGTRHVERAAENAGAADLRLSAADLIRLESLAGREKWTGDRQSFAAYHTERTAAVG